jgi:uncharacterized protein Yka (UPF0111/DUF47 family)
MPKSKKHIRKSIDSLRNLIIEHQKKIKNALETGENLDAVLHWKHEIKVFEEKIDELVEKLLK